MKSQYNLGSLLGIFLLIFLAHIQAYSQMDKLPSGKKEEILRLITEGEENFKYSYLAQASRCYSEAAYLLWTNECFKEASEYYLKALEINEDLGNTNAIKAIATNLGVIFSDIEDYKNALKYFEISLSIKRKEGNKLEIASELLNIAHVLKYLKRLDESNAKLLESLDIFKENNEVKLMKRAYGMLAENYEQLGNSNKSFEYFNLYSTLDNYLKQQQIKETEEKTQKQIKQMEGVTKEAIDQKEATELLLKKSEDSLKLVEAISKERQLQIDLLTKQKQLDEIMMKEQEARLRNIALTRNFIIGVSILLVIIAIILYNGYMNKKRSNTLLAKQKEEINKKNVSINNSINYARRIQNTIIRPPSDLKNFVPESFILFRPRDVVSGDFYWFSDTNLKSILSKEGERYSFKRDKESNDINKFIIAAVDCTGHGVPGALMSMISYNLLNGIISNGIIKPSEILYYLNKGIIKELKQNDKSEVQDGMDIALCLVDKTSKMVQFAGAKNPLVYIKNGTLYRIKGDNQPIGGQIFMDEERIFTNHEIYIDSPTSIYLFSDGFLDQLGGEEGKKYLFINFKDLLLNIHNEPFDKQEEILDSTLYEWRKDQYNQLDDVLVLGFKLIL
ncbi:MAG: SpoIIE family protein phosphatase [Bacteroidales bacterium]|nr:SpoIIE family protein phosphatase [Bacteroidales bacterium]